MAETAAEAARARKLYGMLVVPGAEITQNRLRSRKNAHIIALDITPWISADQSAREILEKIRQQGAFSMACHPHRRTTRRIEISTRFLWENRKAWVATHLYSWKTLLRCEKNWDAIAATMRANVDIALTLYRNGSWAA